MKKFLKRLGVFFAVPIILFIIDAVVFLTEDPLRILRSHEDYSRAPINLEYVSMTIFKKNYPIYHYDSFIFGSSRVLGLKPSSWKHYLNNSDRVFAMTAYHENIIGIYNKIKYLDSLSVPIKNAIIIIDPDMTFAYRDFAAISYNAIKYPDISDNSRLYYYSFMLKSYFIPSLNNLKFKGDIYHDLLGLNDNNDRQWYIRDKDKILDPVTNEFSCPEVEAYFSDPKNESLFVNGERYPVVYGENIYHKQIITDEFQDLLKGIKIIFDKHQTNTYIIISPLYLQDKLNEADMNRLENIFGKDVYDFSGENKFTVSKHNYYERFHYRPHIGDSMLSIIYRNKSN